MESYFAPAPRASAAELRHNIFLASTNPIIDGVMRAVSGLVAVLNEQRQIIAVNDALLKTLGLNDPEKILGLRPGEAIKCIHAHEPPNGCGTTTFCRTCGAAISMVVSLSNGVAQERICAATVNRGDKEMDLCFRVHSAPITIEEDEKFLLLFLQDITKQQQWAAMEQTFFHDINNIIQGLVGASELLVFDDRQEENTLARQIRQLALRLAQEVAIQRTLANTEFYRPNISHEKVALGQAVEEMRNVFANHPAAHNKTLALPPEIPAIEVRTDLSLLMRVLTNMLTNAFEATEAGGEVKCWFDPNKDSITFSVWNRRAIPEKILPRIFQRHFSTKEGMGRGLGTYSMKLFGEEVLGGKVDFNSSGSAGTTFRFTLPCAVSPLKS